MNDRDRGSNDSNLVASDSAPRDRTGDDAAVSTGRTPARAGTRFGVFKRFAAVVALTLMLSTMLLGVTAIPASAAKTGNVAYASDLIDDCFTSGGDPDGYYYGGTYYVFCTYDNASWDWWTEA